SGRARKHRRNGDPLEPRRGRGGSNDRNPRRTSGVTETVASCHDVVVEYGSGDARLRALDGVDFSARAGERVALRGRSGSGKTTLLHVLGGLVRPTAGSVEIEGRELTTLDEAARSATRRSSVAYVFQGSNLLPTFTAYENVAFVGRTVED